MGQPRFEWMLDPGGKGEKLVPLCGVVNSRAVHSNVDKHTESEKGQLSFPMPTMTPDRFALTATLRYPFDHLIALARLILVDYKAHLKAQETAADEAGNDDEFYEAFNNLGDIEEITWLLDREGWMKEDEAKGPGYSAFVGEKWEVEALKDPKHAEKGLLTMGWNHKAEYVIPDAVALRKEKRGVPPEGSWKNEDALLDFLVFLSKHDHRGLFLPMED